MTIILSGGGSGNASREVDLEFLAKLGKGKPVLYIPLARDPPYAPCMEWLLSNFIPLGFTNFKMIEDSGKLEGIDLTRYEGVYIGGGNTHRLLRDLRSSGFLQLGKYIKSGGVAYGGSAGALVMGREIGLNDSVEKYGVTDIRGMNLINDFVVHCHYKEADDQKISEYVKSSGFGVLSMSENAGIIIDGTSLRSVGPGNTFVFTKQGKKILKIGDKVDAKGLK